MCFIFYVVVSRDCGKQPGVTQGLDAFKKANGIKFTFYCLTLMRILC